jgi:hypothetical protein
MRQLLTVLAVLGLHGVLAGCALDDDSTGTDPADTSDDAADLTSRFPSGRNPVPGWHPSRVDQGVDGTLSSSGFDAPFDVRVVDAIAHSPGWDNGGYVVVKILNGSLAGQYIYVSEGVVPVVHVGETVRAGTRLVNRVTNPYNGVFGNIETGFADPHEPLRPLAQALHGYAGDQSVAAITAGEAMNHLIGDLGGARGTNESGHSPDWALLPAQIRDALGL